MAKAIGTLGTIDTLTVGGRVFTDLTTILTFVGDASANARCTMRLNSGSSGYAVTGGKTLTLWAVKIMASTTGLSIAVPAQTDNDVGFASATAFTNPVYFGGATTCWYAAFSTTIPQSVGEGSHKFTVAAAKYLSILSNSNGEHYLGWGYEA